jgi:hypothetical protein
VPRGDVVAAVAAAFVRKELRADLSAALESEANEEQVEGLLTGWGVPGPRGASRAERIAQAVAALDSEERWGGVAEWVWLHRVRIMGRTRLSLKGLMQREAGRIGQCGLRDAEVLALNFYSGPAFVPMNGILRNFPSCILDLLRGDGTVGDNRLGTTFFSFFSGLKKLAQATELPVNRCPPPSVRFLWCQRESVWECIFFLSPFPSLLLTRTPLHQLGSLGGACGGVGAAAMSNASWIRGAAVTECGQETALWAEKCRDAVFVSLYQAGMVPMNGIMYGYTLILNLSPPLERET